MRGLKNLPRQGCCAVLVLVAACAACNRGQRAPVAESQAATPVQATNQPTTVKGCLRAGEAPDTYVLTGKSTTSAQTATYQLQPAQGVAIAEHVGRQVEVDGVIVAQQEITTSSSTQPARNAKGTSGTPAVSTSTELKIKKLNVREIRRLDDSCPDEKQE